MSGLFVLLVGHIFYMEINDKSEKALKSSIPIFFSAHTRTIHTLLIIVEKLQEKAYLLMTC